VKYIKEAGVALGFTRSKYKMPWKQLMNSVLSTTERNVLLPVGTVKKKGIRIRTAPKNELESIAMGVVLRMSTGQHVQNARETGVGARIVRAIFALEKGKPPK